MRDGGTGSREEPGAGPAVERLHLSDEEWRARLTPEQYRVLRRRGTERVGAGCYVHTDAPGTYVCAGCGQVLFRAGDKREHGGWPSFVAPVSPEVVSRHPTPSGLGYSREVRCARCDGHLGHVFRDGPPGTPERFCINSVALRHLPPGSSSEGG